MPSQLLTCKPLPETQFEFFRQLGQFFPTLIDAKSLCPRVPGRTLTGPLASVCEQLGFEKPPRLRQSGASSVVTAAVFFRLRDTLVGVEGDTAADVEKRFNGRLWALRGTLDEVVTSSSAVAASSVTRVAKGPR